MTPTQAAALLAVAAGLDNRKPSADAAESWAIALGKLPLEDCREAIYAHYRESTEWLMPAHIIQRVRALRTERISLGLKDIQPPAEIEAIDDPDEFDRAYRAWLHEVRNQAARGLPVEEEPRAILPAPPPGAEEAAAYMDSMNARWPRAAQPEETS